MECELSLHRKHREVIEIFREIFHAKNSSQHRTNPFVRHAGGTTTRRATDAPLGRSAAVRVEARQAERVATHQQFGSNPEPVVTQSAAEELFGDRFRVVLAAVVLGKHIGVRHGRHRRGTATLKGQ